ncbi:hypothetical protein DFH07DRAFT_766382 [Mycena maculata]|uniref:Uncharacterized protein n=1 Tax=Mycena maculata TaxID=230809 RepID=A0AAD7K5R4_9AGAR|nr:hypothetical protein DFH07DRAFT_766382 [Mycena maculata]
MDAIRDHEAEEGKGGVIHRRTRTYRSAGQDCDRGMRLVDLVGRQMAALKGYGNKAQAQGLEAGCAGTLRKVSHRHSEWAGSVEGGRVEREETVGGGLKGATIKIMMCDLRDGNLSRIRGNGECHGNSEDDSDLNPGVQDAGRWLNDSEEPRDSLETAINRLTTRQVLLENTYKCHQHTGTHYQYSRFWLRPCDDLPDEFRMGPLFIHRIWREDSGKRRPKWIDHENYEPYSISTFSVHALEMEGKKLLAWAAAVVPPSVDVNEAGSIWPAQTPSRKSLQVKSTRVRSERIHRVY